MDYHTYRFIEATRSYFHDQELTNQIALLEAKAVLLKLMLYCGDKAEHTTLTALFGTMTAKWDAVMFERLARLAIPDANVEPRDREHDEHGERLRRLLLSDDGLKPTCRAA